MTYNDDSAELSPTVKAHKPYVRVQEADEQPKRRFTNTTRFVPLGAGYEVAIRQNELYLAMRIVEGCGASPELTEAITQLGKRMESLQRSVEQSIHEATRYDG